MYSRPSGGTACAIIACKNLKLNSYVVNIKLHVVATSLSLSLSLSAEASPIMHQNQHQHQHVYET
jgi:hypothetical protein